MRLHPFGERALRHELRLDQPLIDIFSQDQPLRGSRRRGEGADHLLDLTILDQPAHIGRIGRQSGAAARRIRHAGQILCTLLCGRPVAGDRHPDHGKPAKADRGPVRDIANRVGKARIDLALGAHSPPRGSCRASGLACGRQEPPATPAGGASLFSGVGVDICCEDRQLGSRISSARSPVRVCFALAFMLNSRSVFKICRQSPRRRYLMSAKHADPPRGLMSTTRSPLFDGKFGRLFRSLPPAAFGASEADNIANRTKLGAAMSSDADPADPKDGKDDEESGIPALYTYLGQFIDHDLTFDPASSLQKQNDPDALVDFRSPAFDLDNVYGRGPSDQPYLYDGGNAFLLGDPIHGGTDPRARDLPRNSANVRRALIGDPRNDENAIVSELQGLFLRFHNRVLADNQGISFEDAQRMVRFSYQYVILHDFLPRIIHSSVLDQLKTSGRYDRGKLAFFLPRHGPFMPVEFSAAAYRLGHSMVRPGYRLNDEVLLPIFPDPPRLPEGLTGFRALNPAWGLDWGRFIDIDIRNHDGSDADKSKRLQFAYPLDN